MDDEKKLFGLMAIAEEQQKVVEAATKAMAEERAKLQAEREALKRAVAALETATQGIPSTLQKATSQALSGAAAAAAEEVKGAFSKAGTGLKADLTKVRETATESAAILDKAFKRYTWKFAGAALVFLLLVLGIGWVWAGVLKTDIYALEARKFELQKQVQVLQNQLPQKRR